MNVSRAAAVPAVGLPAAIPDEGSISSTVSVADQFDAGRVEVDLDVAHSYPGDLVVALQSPSGKRVLLSAREGGRGDGIRQTFDVTELMQGEPVRGTWTLSVQDAGRSEVGVLKGWSLRVAPRDPNAPPPAPPPADDRSLYSGLVQLNAARTADGRYQLLDRTRGLGVETKDAQQLGGSGASISIYDDNNVWGEPTDDPRHAAAVDAQYAAQMTYDYLRDILGRDSIDGHGAKLVVAVHAGEGILALGAQWDGTQVNAGDGYDDLSSPLVTLDVIGHELIHGLIQNSTGLNTISGSESGALNESFADILGGVGVEWYALQRNPQLQGKVDPLLQGEQNWTPGKPGDAKRSMLDPAEDGWTLDHYSQFATSDTRDIHRGMGISNNAFALLVQGGTNRTSKKGVEGGIGIEKGLRIFGKALLEHMRSDSTFADARVATGAAAAELYGADSVEVKKVGEAWTAVGVEAPSS